VLATVPTGWNGSELQLEPEPNRCNRSYHTKTRTVAIGPVLPPKTQYFNLTTWPLIKYFSYDHIVIWWIRRLCSFSCSFTSHYQICDPTNVGGVAIEKPRISLKMCPNFTATQQISVGSQIWMLEGKERQIVHNLRIDHVTIQSELRYVIGAKGARTMIWNHHPGATWPENSGFKSSPGNNCAKT